MNEGARRVRRTLQIGNGIAALSVAAALLGVLGAGAGGVPALGRLLVPGHGAWARPSPGTHSHAPPGPATSPALAGHATGHAPVRPARASGARGGSAHRP
jgi:hypothetical protein